MSIYEIDGFSLTLDQIERMIADSGAIVAMSADARTRCGKTRAQIDRWLQKDAPAVYGVNTGLGNLKDVVVPAEQHILWNKTLPYPHACGFGNWLDADIAKLALMLRANILCRAYSAVRPALIDRMLDIYNAGIAPAIYEEGSTGLSDLAPLAQMAMTVAGLADAKAIFHGQVMPSQEALREAGLAPEFDLACKEVLAQMNGSTITQAMAVMSMLHFRQVYQQYLAMEKLPSAAAKQPAYESVIAFAEEILNRENNISCDNPLLFEVGPEQYQAVMGCNCSNTQVGYVLDLMSILLSEMAQDFECKCGQTQLLSDKLRTMTMQASADNIPTKAGQEDHVEYSYTAARKFRHGVDVLERLLQAM